MRNFLSTAEALVLLYAVHALDAPDPVYRWIESLGECSVANIPAMVLSVSGGGEAWPNTTCRQKCIAALESRGFSVEYEDMLIMPCNWIFRIDDRLALHLLKVLPAKTEAVTVSFLSGTRRRLPFRKPDILQRHLPDMEKKGIRNFPKSITIGESCTACAWCAKSCPVGNIAMRDGRPVFASSCIGCFRCVYGCPSGSLKSGNIMVIKGGFDLDALEKRSALGKEAGIESTDDYRKLAKGFLFSALGKYLDEGYALIAGAR